MSKRIYIYICVCVCRMEKRDHANEEEKEWMVVDEGKEEASDAPSASAGNGLINFLL